MIREASWCTYLQLTTFTTTHSYTGVFYAQVLEFYTKVNLIEEEKCKTLQRGFIGNCLRGFWSNKRGKPQLGSYPACPPGTVDRGSVSTSGTDSSCPSCLHIRPMPAMSFLLLSGLLMLPSIEDASEARWSRYKMP